MAARSLMAPMLDQLAHATRLDQVASVVRGAARTLIGCDGVTFVVRDADQCHYLEEALHWGLAMSGLTPDRPGPRK